MTDEPLEPIEFDKGNVTVISHICIRDPDTGEIILSQRDKPARTIEKKNASDI